MEITRDAILRVVKAARMSKNVAESLQQIMVDKKSRSWADEVFGQLSDALFIMIDDRVKAGENFDDSMTMKILNSDMSDGAVADTVITLNRLRNRIQGNEEVHQPKPQIISKEAGQRMYVQSCGYQYTPEGEFR